MIADPRMKPRILLAAGGTGGHMFPAESLAGILLARGFAVDLVTDERGSGFAERLPEVGLHRLPAGGLAGKSVAARLGNLWRLARGFCMARRLVKTLRPRVAIGFGGYASVPALLAAQGRRVKTVIHEQNAVAGRANRLLARRADRIAISFASVRHFESLPAARRILTGNPVRREIAALADRPYDAPEAGAPFHLLVFGGSQGARFFSAILPAAIAMLAPERRARLRLVQQCRAEDIDTARAAFAKLDLAAELAPFFADMARRLAEAHLVIARAGASTIAELAMAGRPAILVPLPHAIDDHQRANAEALAASGGAWVMAEAELTPTALARELDRLMEAREMLARAAIAAARFAKPDAARNLADIVASLAEGAY